MSRLLVPPYALMVGAQRAALGGAAAPPFNPSVYGLDALDNLYAVYGVARLLTSWTGNLVRLRRSTDNVEADFGYAASTGFLDTAAIAAWLGGGTAFITTFYDQSGNARDGTQPTSSAQPTLNLAGTFPVGQADGNDAISPAIAGWARNTGAASVVMVGKYASAGGATQQGAGVNNNAGGSRAIIGRAASGLSGVFRAYGRRLDADSLQNTTGLTGSDNWVVQIARFDWTNSDLYHRVDGATESNLSFQTSGVTSDTDSANMGFFSSVIGGAVPMATGSQISAVVFTRDLLTTGEDSSLVTSLAALKGS